MIDNKNQQIQLTCLISNVLYMNSTNLKHIIGMVGSFPFFQLPLFVLFSKLWRNKTKKACKTCSFQKGVCQCHYPWLPNQFFFCCKRLLDENRKNIVGNNIFHRCTHDGKLGGLKNKISPGKFSEDLESNKAPKLGTSQMFLRA